MTEADKQKRAPHYPQIRIVDHAYTFEWECARCGHVWSINSYPTKPCKIEDHSHA